jgi:hypothetical protein
VKADHNKYIEYKTETDGEITQYYEMTGRRVVIPCLQLLGRDIHTELFLRDDKTILSKRENTKHRYAIFHFMPKVTSNNKYMKYNIKIEIKARGISS